ncbi:MAG: hypothetical protein AAGH92_05765 [Planctomycetota bacterium]
MLAMRNPPDFSELAKLARGVPSDRPWVPRLGRRNPEIASNIAYERRRLPRRGVDAPVYLGVIPPLCEKLRLSRIPVSVFKPLDGGWATDLSTQGVSLLFEKPVEVGGRHWLRLDHVASRPTILPGRILSCEPVAPEGNDPEAEGSSSPAEAFRVRIAFLLNDPTISERLGFVDDPMHAVA